MKAFGLRKRQDYFDSATDTIEALLHQIHDGEIQIPDLQREWVWSADRIQVLLETALSGLPLGHIMMAMVGDKQMYSPRPLFGVAVDPAKIPWALLLDGQQRLTSLYLALCGDKPVYCKDSKQGVYYFCNILKLGANERTDLVVRTDEQKRVLSGDDSSVRLHTREDEFAHYMFPLNLTCNPTRWVHDFTAYHGESSEARELSEILDAALTMLKAVKLSSTRLRDTAPRHVVHSAFLNHNQGGVPLSQLDLLHAEYLMDGFNLREDRKRRNEILYSERPVLSGMKDDYLLNIIGLLHVSAKWDRVVEAGGGYDSDGVPCRLPRFGLSNLSLAHYQKNVDAAETGLRAVSTFLMREGIPTAQQVPYRLQIVVLAALLCRLGSRWMDPLVYARLRKWFWAAIFCSYYEKGTIDERGGYDLVHVEKWIAGEVSYPPVPVRKCEFSYAMFYEIKVRSPHAKAIMALLQQQQQSHDWRTGIPAIELVRDDMPVESHHVFPKKICSEVNVNRNLRESILNRALISSATNKTISGDMPSTYLLRLERVTGSSAQQVDAMVRTHCIDPRYLRDDDAVGYFVDRARQIGSLICEASGCSIKGQPVECLGPSMGRMNLDNVINFAA